MHESPPGWPACSACRPHDPDFNPIKNLLAKIKVLLRREASGTIDTLWDAIGRILDLVTHRECQNILAAAEHDPDWSDQALAGGCSDVGSAASGPARFPLMRRQRLAKEQREFRRAYDEGVARGMQFRALTCQTRPTAPKRAHPPP